MQVAIGIRDLTLWLGLNLPALIGAVVIPLGSGLFIMLVPPTTAWYQDLAGVIAYAAVVVMLFGGFVSAALRGRNALWERVPNSPQDAQVVVQVDYKGRLSDRMAPGHDIWLRVADPGGSRTHSESRAQGGGQAAWATINVAEELTLERSVTYIASFWERAAEKGKWQLMYAGKLTDAGW
jgi:hypothetical protein